MATEWEEAGHGDLEVPVPGSRPRVKHLARERPRVEGAWDAHPRTYRVGGKDVELFPISAMALALGRSVPTIRSWERRRWLPKAALRAPRAGDDRLPGHRLYSRRFIAGVIVIAREEGVLDTPGVDVGGTEFPTKAQLLFEEVGG